MEMTWAALAELPPPTSTLHFYYSSPPVQVQAALPSASFSTPGGVPGPLVTPVRGDSLTFLSIPVVQLLLFAVAEHVVSLCDLLELILCSGGFVFVRVKPESLFSVRLLDLLLRGALLDAQGFVVIFTHHNPGLEPPYHRIRDGLSRPEHVLVFNPGESGRIPSPVPPVNTPQPRVQIHTHPLLINPACRPA